MPCLPVLCASAVRFLLLFVVVSLHDECRAGELRGEIVDAENGKPLAARVYIQDSSGKPFFPR